MSLFTDVLVRVPRPLGRRARAGLAGLVLAGAASLAQAASVSAPADLPTAPPPPPAAGGGRVLDKALSGDVSTGSRNLDMLLEMQRTDAAAAASPARPPPARESSTLPATPAAPLPVPAVAPTHTAPLAVAPALSAAEAAAGPGAAAPQSGATVGTGWSGGRDAGPSAARVDDGGVPVISDPAAAARVKDWLLWPRQAMDFLREHVLWLAAGLAVLGLVLGLVKLFDRRV